MGDSGSLEERNQLIMSGSLRTRPSATLRTLTLATAGASMLFGVADASPPQSAAASRAAVAAPGAAQDAAPAPSDQPPAGEAAPNTPGSTSGGGSKSSTRGSSSTSWTISFKKNGKSVRIEENGSGITVTVDGETVRARNVDDLKKQHPEAYQLYVEKPGFAIGSAGGSASASGGQSSSSTKGSQPGSAESTSRKSRDRSVTVTDNGKTVTIVENASGITVTVGEKIVRARNASELKKESAEAFQLYEKHLNKPGARREGSDAEDLLGGNLEAGPDASELLREKLKEMRNEKPDDPRFQELIDRMLKELDK